MIGHDGLVEEALGFPTDARVELNLGGSRRPLARFHRPPRRQRGEPRVEANLDKSRRTALTA